MSETCIPVALGERSYNIYIENGLLASGRGADLIDEIVEKGGRVCVVTHPKLSPLYAEPLVEQLKARNLQTALIAIPAGERYKNLRTVERLYYQFVRHGLDRKSVVVAVGGGVLGDTVGFAAASYLRGIRLVQVPTTLLAQVDSSVGGKTGVDLPEGKNLVGAFHQPAAVLIDPLTLKTLPLRERRSGLAEVIKYGIIYDSAFFDHLSRRLLDMWFDLPSNFANVIARSCEIKAEVVGQDETEQGLRAILNFGHTVGHAIESVTQYRRYKHGEAIAIGMASACLVGEELGVTPPEVTQAVVWAISRAGLGSVFPADLDVEAILAAMYRDKKTLSGKLRFVLARQIGEVFLADAVPAETVRAALARQTEEWRSRLSGPRTLEQTRPETTR